MRQSQIGLVIQVYRRRYVGPVEYQILRADLRSVREHLAGAAGDRPAVEADHAGVR